MNRPVTITKKGQIICELCGNAFDKPLSHVWQVHHMSAREYKQEFGLDTTKGLMSDRATVLARIRVYENPKCITKNLLKYGKKTRFKKGHKGRPKEMCSKETLEKLKKRITSWRKGV